MDKSIDRYSDPNGPAGNYHCRQGTKLGNVEKQ